MICKEYKYRELVRKYYTELGVREWRRLVRDPYHRLEYDTTMHFLTSYLPRGGLILDAGGGPGRYTIELAKLGYELVLLDLTPKMLKIAKRQVKRSEVSNNIVGIIEGCVDLSMFRDGSFDAVICLGGTLSHIVDKKFREMAIEELVRVAKRGSPIFISVIGRLGALINELVNFPEEIAIKEVFQSIRDTGNYYGGYGFAPCHLYLPEELEEELKRRGVNILKVVGLEGLASHHRKEVNRLFRKYPKAWEVWWETHLKTCTHPSSVGISEHFLVICRKP